MIKKIMAAILSVMLAASGIAAVCATGDDLPILPVVLYKQGDVNRDSKVNIKDATQIQKYLALMVEFDKKQTKLADVDGKEGISIKDVTHIQKWIVGLVDELFGGEVATLPEINVTTESQDNNTATAPNYSSTLTTEEIPSSADATSEATESTSENSQPTHKPEVTENTANSSVPQENTEESSSSLVTDPVESSTFSVPSTDNSEPQDTTPSEPVSSEIVTDPEESSVATEPSSEAVTEPASTEATQTTTRDPNKPIELPFVPAS